MGGEITAETKKHGKGEAGTIKMFIIFFYWNVLFTVSTSNEIKPSKMVLFCLEIMQYWREAVRKKRHGAWVNKI